MNKEKIISRYNTLQTQWEIESQKERPNWARLQTLKAQLNDMKLTYPEYFGEEK